MLLWWVLSLSCSGADQEGNPLSSTNEAAAVSSYSDQYGYNYGPQTHGEHSDGMWKLGWQLYILFDVFRVSHQSIILVLSPLSLLNSGC